jgi:hypothetical protein
MHRELSSGGLKGTQKLCPGCYPDSSHLLLEKLPKEFVCASIIKNNYDLTISRLETAKGKLSPNEATNMKCMT